MGRTQILGVEPNYMKFKFKNSNQNFSYNVESESGPNFETPASEARRNI